MNTSKQVQARQGAEQTHTPTPWIKEAKWGDLHGANGDPVMVYGLGLAHVGTPTPDSEANAAFIVRAVNAHDALTADNDRLKGVCDELVAALNVADEQAQAGLNSGDPKHWEAALDDILGTVRAALAKAGAV